MTERQRRRGDHFCCAGCARVFELIHGEGLGRYYDLRRGATAPPAELRPDGFAWFDRLLEDGSAIDPDRPRRITLDLQGVHCAACVWLLQTLFSRLDGAHEIRINPALGKAEIVWTPSRCDLKSYLATAERFGYRFGPERKGEPLRSRSLVIRMGVTVGAALNVMVFTLCYYLGLAPADGLLYDIFGVLNAALALLAVSVGGSLFIGSAARGLRHGLIHLDLPIALGITLAFSGSVYALVTQGPEAAYFDTVTIFIALMLVGRWLQERVLERNRNALLAAEGVEPLTTRRYRDGHLQSVAVLDLSPGDELWIVPGDLVPVESIVLASPASLALDWITGESEVQVVPPGGTVPSGAFNAGDRTLRLSATEPFEASQLRTLLRSVTSTGPEESRPDATPAAAPRFSEGGTAPPTPRDRRWWHRVGAVYATSVLLFALAAFLLWLPQGSARALEVTVAVLVVTCPCALGLATPLAQELTLQNLRLRGVFLRTGSFLDKALSIRKVLFDKTGTLTSGRLILAEAGRSALAALSPEETAVLYNMTARSNHPVSHALYREISQREGTRTVHILAGDDEVVECPGVGLTWRNGTVTWGLGRPADDRPATSAVGTQTALSADGRLLAVFSFEEEIRPGAGEEVAALADQGIEVHLLSGDRQEKAWEVGARLGLPPERCLGRLGPEAKADVVRRLDRRDTLMVGDGLNDAPSFEAAYCAATPGVDRAALAARSDFYFLGDGIVAVRAAISEAQRLRSVVRGNLLLAVLYNSIALGLCFAGLVTPVVAAILMPISSAAVVGRTALRLSRQEAAWTS